MSKQSWATIPPSTPPSPEIVPISNSNIPPNASDFWISTFRLMSAWVSRRASFRMISRFSDRMATMEDGPSGSVRKCCWTS